MFDSSVELAELDGNQLAAAITDNHAELLRRECRVLELACAWADLHTQLPGDYSPLVERARFFGGPGIPAISEFCVAEWAALQQPARWPGRRCSPMRWTCGIDCPGCGDRFKPGRSGPGRPARSPNRPGR